MRLEMKQRKKSDVSSAIESIWVYHVALSCCGLEVDAATGPRFDWERLGCKIVNDHRHADLLFISGPVNRHLGPEIKRVHGEMKKGTFVVAVGSCASTGGMFSAAPSDLGGIDNFIPVDIFVPGCPPRPESLIHAVLMLKEKMKRRDS